MDIDMSKMFCKDSIIGNAMLNGTIQPPIDPNDDDFVPISGFVLNPINEISQEEYDIIMEENAKREQFAAQEAYYAQPGLESKLRVQMMDNEDKLFSGTQYSSDDYEDLPKYEEEMTFNNPEYNKKVYGIENPADQNQPAYSPQNNNTMMNQIYGGGGYGQEQQPSPSQHVVYESNPNLERLRLQYIEEHRREKEGSSYQPNYYQEQQYQQNNYQEQQYQQSPEDAQYNFYGEPQGDVNFLYIYEPGMEERIDRENQQIQQQQQPLQQNLPVQYQNEFTPRYEEEMQSRMTYQTNNGMRSPYEGNPFQGSSHYNQNNYQSNQGYYNQNNNQGYYGNNYQSNQGYYGSMNNYYNPYMRATQMQEQMRMQKEFQDNQIMMWKLLFRINNNYFGRHQDDMEEYLSATFDDMYEDKREKLRQEEKKRAPKLYVQIVIGEGDDEEVIIDTKTNGYYENVYPHIDEDAIQARLMNSLRNSVVGYNPEREQYMKNCDKMHQEHYDKYGKMGLIEYWANCGSLILEGKINAAKRKIGTGLYDSDKHIDFSNRSIIEQSYFAQAFGNDPSQSGVRPGPNLGSLEVTVPDKFKRKYDENKEAFLQKIRDNAAKQGKILQ